MINSKAQTLHQNIVYLPIGITAADKLHVSTLKSSTYSSGMAAAAPHPAVVERSWRTGSDAAGVAAPGVRRPSSAWGCAAMHAD